MPKPDEVQAVTCPLCSEVFEACYRDRRAVVVCPCCAGFVQLTPDDFEDLKELKRTQKKSRTAKGHEEATALVTKIRLFAILKHRAIDWRIASILITAVGTWLLLEVVFDCATVELVLLTATPLFLLAISTFFVRWIRDAVRSPSPPVDSSPPEPSPVLPPPERIAHLWHLGASDSWRRFNWYDFEIVLLIMFSAKGYKTEPTPPAHDGGIDGYIWRDEVDHGAKIGIQAKRYSPHGDWELNAKVVRAFCRALRQKKLTRGIVATTGRITAEARHIADNPGMGLRIEIYNLDRLCKQGAGIRLNRESIESYKEANGLPSAIPAGMFGAGDKEDESGPF